MKPSFGFSSILLAHPYVHRSALEFLTAKLPFVRWVTVRFFGPVRGLDEHQDARLARGEPGTVAYV
jgi:hypothetical protein